MNGKKKALIFLAALALLFVAISAWTAKRTFDERKASEVFTEVDYYSMQEYCDINSEAVMAALKSGKPDKLTALLTAAKSSEGVDKLFEFADWKNADFENAVGMGSGSLSPAPDADGRMDVSERFFVDVDGKRYVLFIESVTSRWGRDNDGVSAVAATSYSHFDELGYAWNAKDDDGTVRAGTLFWPGNQAEGTDPDY